MSRSRQNEKQRLGLLAPAHSLFSMFFLHGCEVTQKGNSGLWQVATHFNEFSHNSSHQPFVKASFHVFIFSYFFFSWANHPRIIRWDFFLSSEVASYSKLDIFTVKLENVHETVRCDLVRLQHLLCWNDANDVKKTVLDLWSIRFIQKHFPQKRWSKKIWHWVTAE